MEMIIKKITTEKNIKLFIDEHLNEGRLNFHGVILRRAYIHPLNLIEIVKEAIKIHPIIEVDVSRNVLGAYAIDMVKVLMESKIIKGLNLQGNSLDRSAIIVAEEISKSETITVLNLSRHNLGRRSDDRACGIEVARHLGNSKSLIELNLAMNEIKEDGMEVVKGLAKCKTLRYLSLSDNQLGKAAIDILKEIDASMILDCLDISFNGIDPNITNSPNEFKNIKEIINHSLRGECF